MYLNIVWGRVGLGRDNQRTAWLEDNLMNDECLSDNIYKYIYDCIWSIISLWAGSQTFNTCVLHVMNVIIGIEQ